MESRAALGAATALALTVTGGVSALFLTIGQASGTNAEPTPADNIVAVEYVDQYGNPVPAPQDLDTSTGPDVVLVNPDGTVVAASTSGVDPTAAAQPYQQAPPTEGDGQGEYDEGEHEVDEHEEAEDDEGQYEDDDHDYEDGDEYAVDRQVGEVDHG